MKGVIKTGSLCVQGGDPAGSDSLHPNRRPKLRGKMERRGVAKNEGELERRGHVASRLHNMKVIFPLELHNPEKTKWEFLYLWGAGRKCRGVYS